jgi:hypothetical protein
MGLGMAPSLVDDEGFQTALEQHTVWRQRLITGIPASTASAFITGGAHVGPAPQPEESIFLTSTTLKGLRSGPLLSERQLIDMLQRQLEWGLEQRMSGRESFALSPSSLAVPEIITPAAEKYA